MGTHHATSRLSLVLLGAGCHAAAPTPPAAVPAACLDGAGAARFVAPDGPADGDGSAARPFPSVPAALVDLTAGTELRLAPGAYPDPVALDDPRAHAGTRIVGCGGDVRLASGLVVTGERSATLRGVELAALAVEGGSWFQYADEVRLTDVRLAEDNDPMSVDASSITMAGAVSSTVTGTPDTSSSALRLGGSRLVVQGELVTSGGFQGVLVEREAELVVEGSLTVEEADFTGLYATNGGIVEIAGELVVREAAPAIAADADGVVRALPGSRVIASARDRGAVEALSDAVVELGDAVLEATGDTSAVVLGDATSAASLRLLPGTTTEVEAGGSAGCAVGVQPGSLLTLEGALVVHASADDCGIYLAGGELLALPGSRIDVDGAGTAGLVVDAGGRAVVEDGSVTGVGPTSYGLVADDASLEVRGAWSVLPPVQKALLVGGAGTVRFTDTASFEATDTRDCSAYLWGEAEVENAGRVALSDGDECGVALEGDEGGAPGWHDLPGSRLEIVDTSGDGIKLTGGAWFEEEGVAVVRAPEADGLNVGDGSRWTASESGRLEVDGARGHGVRSDGGEIASAGVIQVDGAGDAGLRLGDGAVASIAWLEVVGAAGAGVLVHDASLRLTGGGVADTLPAGAYGGDGIAAEAPLALELAGLDLSDNPRAGLLVVGATGTLSTSTVTGNAWSVVHQDCAAALVLTDVVLSGNVDDTPHLCDGSPDLEVPP